MSISIWIPVVIILSIAFLFYYKKNRFKEQKPEKEDIGKKDKLSFTDIDKMLSHISVDKNATNISEEQDKNLSEKKDKQTEDNKSDIDIDLKEKVIGSIFLDKKKKK